MPGPARPRGIGSSSGSATKTSVSASRTRSFATNFGRTTRATTSDAGRRSIVSQVSSLTRFLMNDARSRVTRELKSRSLCDAAKHRRERASVDRDEWTIAGGVVGQLEERPVKALVEEAVAVVIEPEDLDAIASLAREDE